MQEHLQVLEDLIIEQVLQLDVIPLLSDSVFGLLPEFPWDVVVGEALAVEHKHVEEILNNELKLACFDIKSTLLFGITRKPCDPNSILVFRLLDSLCFLHFILSESIAVLAYQHLVADGSHPELNPLNEIDRLEREFDHWL